MATNEKIKKESSVSRVMQQQVPSADLDETYDEHSNITQFDTPELKIAEDRNEEDIPVNEVIYRNEIITSSPKSYKHIEIIPTSNLTEYNKIKVDIDREGHLFYFDWTDNNNRTHLRHPSGTYFTIDDGGSYNLKVIKDFNKIVKGSENTIINLGKNQLIKYDRKISIQKTDYLSVSGKRNVTVGNDLGTIIKNNEYRQVGSDRVSIIDGIEDIRVGKYKTQEISGAYTITSRDFISLRAPTIIIDAGKIAYRSKGTNKENISGLKEILAEKLVLSGVDGVSLTSMGNYSQVVKGISEETVSGVPALPSGTDMKIITVNLGGYKVECKMGGITLESLVPLPISIKNALGSIDIGITGAIDLAGPTADVSIKETGVVEVNGSLGSMTIGLDSLELDHSVMIKLGSGASSEAVPLGLSLLQWLNQHNHVAPNGSTSPPVQPAQPTLLSQKVFVE